MDSAPILLPSPRKSPFRPSYEREIHLDSTSEEDEEREENESSDDLYSYDPSPDEAVFDEDSQEDSAETQSPHTSDDDDLISTIPTDHGSRAPSTIYTPHKRRSPFRNPSSVRNLQLDTTPPHLASPIKTAYHLSPSPRSRTSTPRSVYSTHSNTYSRSTKSSPGKKEKRKQKVKKETPLVLLHCALLPVTLEYPQSLLDTVLPASKLADLKLLMDKVGQPVVQDRGVLIAHPRDDYELLEERLLEALELAQGTVTRDGHFVPPEERGSSRASYKLASRSSLHHDEHNNEHDPDPEREEEDDEEERTELGEHDARHVCEDCGQKIQGISGDYRWDIKVYAANGLMREGAWMAAWKEMERVDVEIQPFVSDELKRELESRWEELELLMQAEQRDTAARKHEEAALQEVMQAVEEQRNASRLSGRTADAAEIISESRTPDLEKRLSDLDEDRIKEIYGEQTPSIEESTLRHNPSATIPPGHFERRSDFSHQYAPPNQIPLSTLLANHLRIVFQDGRNIVIGLLSAVVLLLAILAVQSPSTQLGPSTVVEKVQSHVPSAVISAVSEVQTVVASVVDKITQSNPVSVSASSIASSVGEVVSEATKHAISKGESMEYQVANAAATARDNILDAAEALPTKSGVMSAAAAAVSGISDDSESTGEGNIGAEAGDIEAFDNETETALEL